MALPEEKEYEYTFTLRHDPAHKENLLASLRAGLPAFCGGVAVVAKQPAITEAKRRAKK